MIFSDREEAGRVLAQVLKEKINKENNPIILAIPRGGIVVAYALAKELNIPVSLVIVRKLGIPWNEEAGFGSVDPDGSVYLDTEIVRYARLDDETIRSIVDRELKKIRERERKFLPQGYPDLKDREVIIVDDGVATGYTAIAASEFARRRGAKKVIVAVPVCPSDAKVRFKEHADEFVCYYPSPESHFAVGMFYRDFHQVEDEEFMKYIEELKNLGLFEPV